MKWASDKVSLLITELLHAWEKDSLATLKKPRHVVAQTLTDIVLSEFKLEEDLNRDTEALLQKFKKQFESGELDRRKMFAMCKAQLAKERKIIL